MSARKHHTVVAGQRHLVRFFPVSGLSVRWLQAEGGARYAVGASSLPHCTIFARFQHVSQACHRWCGTPALYCSWRTHEKVSRPGAGQLVMSIKEGIGGDEAGQWVAAADRNQAHTRFIKDGRFIRCTVIAFVTQDTGPVREHKGQFMNRCLIVITTRHHSETDGQALWRAYQMQAPAEELLFFRGPVTAVIAPAHLTCSGAPAPDGRSAAASSQ